MSCSSQNTPAELTLTLRAGLFLPDRRSDRQSDYATLCMKQLFANSAVLLSEEKSDEQLMEAYRDGDLQAFDQLFNRFRDILYRYLARQAGNTAIAEEIFQETWAALIKNRKNYSVQAKFKTFLFHIAHNKLIDFYRSKQNTVNVSYEDHHDESLIEEYSDAGLDHKTDISKKHEYLLTLLEKLPAAQRDVFVMHEETGMTLPEIAEVMNVSRDTVKSRLRYAIQRLRQGMRRFA